MWNGFCKYFRTLSIWKSNDLEFIAEAYTVMNVRAKAVRDRLSTVLQDKNKVAQMKLRGVECKTKKKVILHLLESRCVELLSKGRCAC